MVIRIAMFGRVTLNTDHKRPITGVGWSLCNVSLRKQHEHINLRSTINGNTAFRPLF
jgi:hypothetical protein